MKRFTPGMLAALLICFFTFAAGEVINRTVFERLPHLEDEFAYYYQAKIFAGGHWYVERDTPVKVFWQPFVIQPENAADGINKRFGKYTPGWPLLLALGVVTGTPWLVNAFLGMLSVAIVYRMAREIFGEAVGLVSALLLAISPMALLLNATMMSHVPAMFMAVLFVYGYWRMTRNGKRRYAWAALAGLSLGMMIATRPLSAVAIAVPVILHALSRLLDSAFAKEWRSKLPKTLKPLIVLSLFVLPTGALWPLANYIWTGNPTTNTYLMLWSYDKPGFGPGYGLMGGGHTLEYGFRNARTDMQVYLRDLFGFTLNSDVADYLSKNLGWGAGIGLSWVLVAIGFIAGRKNEWIWLFGELFLAIVIAQMTYWIGSVVHGGAAYSLRYWYEATFGVAIVAGYGTVQLARSVRGKGFWVMFAAALIYLVGWMRYQATAGEVPDLYRQIGIPLIIAWGVMIIGMFWDQVGATAKAKTTKVAYLNGIMHSKATPTTVPLRATTFAQKLRQLWLQLWPGYILVVLACAVSLIGYTPARFKESLPDWPDGLYRYNIIGQQQVEALKEARAKYGKPGQPVLIIVLRDPNGTGDNWRNYGAAMAMTSPYENSDVLVARIFEKVEVPDFVQRFPGRLVLYQVGANLYQSIDDAMNGAPPDSNDSSGT